MIPLIFIITYIFYKENILISPRKHSFQSIIRFGRLFKINATFLKNLLKLRHDSMFCTLQMKSKERFDRFERYFSICQKKVRGLSRDLNPGPPAPKAGIIPLDH